MKSKYHVCGTTVIAWEIDLQAEDELLAETIAKNRADDGISCDCKKNGINIIDVYADDAEVIGETR